MRALIISFLVLFAGCSSMAVDYHLAKITEAATVSRQNYHVIRVKELLGPDWDYYFEEHHAPAVAYPLGYGAFTTSS